MPGRLPPRRLGRRPRIHQVLRDSAVHKQHFLPRHAFSIKRSALLQGMKYVVNDADVLSKKLLAQALIQAGALVLHRSRSKVIKHESDEIKNGSRFENHRVTSRREFLCLDGKTSLFAGAFRELLR